MTNVEKIWIKSMEWCKKYCRCHQMPERSFFIKGYQMPLCARCTGIAIGHFLAFLVAPFVHFSTWIAAFMFPLAIDGTVQYYSKYESNNLKRIFTGILYGFSFTSTIFSLFWLLQKKAKKQP